MTTKFLALISVIGLVSVCLVQGQLLVPGGSPDESPSPTKHRAHKKAEATASPAEEAASPSPAGSPAEATASPAEEAASPSPAESPAASPSPGKRRAQKKAEATAAASPAAAESTAAAPASPTEKRSKFTLRDLFKPKTSASAAPAAASQAPASPAPAKPAVTEPATNAPAQGGGHGLVWVNTELHVYHREGSRFYGTSKKGKYVTEADAIKEGDRAAGKGQ
jgi:pyruvate/2-oxoglutarate dehydrogenase complex dihydrolipoamide acyltransferase (E2) component